MITSLVSQPINALIILITISSWRILYGAYKSKLGLIDELTAQKKQLQQIEDRFSELRLPSINIGITLCTLMGLLGTFWGMTQGLSDLGLNNSDLDQITSGAKSLIGGMSAAFSTSLMGIFCSIVLMILQAFYSFRLQSKLTELREAFKDRLSTPLSLLKVIAKSQSAQDPEKMASAVELLAQAAAGFNLESLGVQIGQSLEKSVREHMVPPLIALSQEVKDLRLSHEAQREEMLRELISELQAEVFNPINQQLSTLSTQLKVSDQNTQRLVGAVEVVTQDIQLVNERVNESLVKMQETQAQTVRALGIFLQKLHAELTRTEETIRETTNASLKLLVAQQEVFQKTAQEASEMLTQVRNDTRELLEEGVKEVAKQASAILISARHEVEVGLRAVPEMLTKTREETQSQLTSFREEYQQRLQAFFDQQNELLNEVLGTHKDALADIVAQMRSTFEREYERRLALGIQTDSQLETLSASAKLLDALNVSLSTQSATMLPKIAEASQGVAIQLRSLHEMYAESNHTFVEASKRFGNEVARVTTGLQDRQDHLFESQDRELSKILTHLVQIVTLLFNTTNEVKGALQLAKYDR